jgi:Ca-activated chloride channel family protein
MDLNFQNRAVLFLIFLLIPVVVFIHFRIKKYANFFIAKKRLKLRVLCWAFSWVCAIIALSGPSWGKKMVEVFKSGTSAVFVFDISYSMMAEDATLDIFEKKATSKNISRLSASQNYILQLLRNLNGTAVAGVLTKGEGILAIPLTEDYYSLENLVNVLSPTLVSSPGSSIAQGIETAITAFPPQSARNSVIVVCTDGDETDNALGQAVQKSAKYGIKVVFIGFGSTKETSVLAGDGKTSVYTALKEDRLKAVALKTPYCSYVRANDVGSMIHVLESINNKSSLITGGEMKPVMTQKMVPIERYGLFLLLSIIFFMLGFVFSELKIKKGMFLRFYMVFFSLLVPFINTSCTRSVNDAALVLNGKYKWIHHDYDNAIAIFLSVINDAQTKKNTELEQYGIYGLATSYLMQNETEAALSRLKTISPNAPKAVLSKAWYNIGIIQYRAGKFQLATEAFKQSLRIDGSNVNAKINYELSLIDTKATVPLGSQEISKIDETQTLSKKADSVFSVIRENEEQQWKNSQQKQENTSVIDY